MIDIMVLGRMCRFVGQNLRDPRFNNNILLNLCVNSERSLNVCVCKEGWGWVSSRDSSFQPQPCQKHQFYYTATKLASLATQDSYKTEYFLC